MAPEGPAPITATLFALIAMVFNYKRAGFLLLLTKLFKIVHNMKDNSKQCPYETDNLKVLKNKHRCKRGRRTKYLSASREWIIGSRHLHADYVFV
jgi:hypothetical protein